MFRKNYEVQLLWECLGTFIKDITGEKSLIIRKQRCPWKTAPSEFSKSPFPSSPRFFLKFWTSKPSNLPTSLRLLEYQTVLQHFHCFGWIFNLHKSLLDSTHHLEYPGLVLDTVQAHVFLSRNEAPIQTLCSKKLPVVWFLHWGTGAHGVQYEPEQHLFLSTLEKSSLCFSHSFSDTNGLHFLRKVFVQWWLTLHPC